RVRRAGAFQDVLDTPAAGQSVDRVDRVFTTDVDHLVGAEPHAHVEPLVAGAGQDDRLSPFATPTPMSPIGPGPMTTTPSPAITPPITSSPYIAVPAVTTSVASASLISSGTCASVLMLLTAYSAKPPSVLKPFARCPFARKP